MEVVRYDHPVSDFYVGDQSEPASNALLKRRNFRKEPMRPPEIGLLLEANDAAIG
jgi:hypothetical protein